MARYATCAPKKGLQGSQLGLIIFPCPITALRCACDWVHKPCSRLERALFGPAHYTGTCGSFHQPLPGIRCIYQLSAYEGLGNCKMPVMRTVFAYVNGTSFNHCPQAISVCLSSISLPFFFSIRISNFFIEIQSLQCCQFLYCTMK